MAIAFRLVLVLQVWQGACDAVDGGCAHPRGGGDLPSIASCEGPEPWLHLNNATAMEFLKNMSKATETFDRISYRRGSGVVLRGIFDNRVFNAVGKQLPTLVTAPFSHHWLELHLANASSCARFPERTCEHCFVLVAF